MERLRATLLVLLLLTVGGVPALAQERDLSGQSLIGADLVGADLAGGNLKGADLREAYLREARLERPERGTDLDWYQRGEITITPLRMGATAVDLLETLESWELEAKRGV